MKNGKVESYPWETPKDTKKRIAIALRYKKPVLDTISYEAIESELCNISEACGDIRYVFEEAMDTITESFDGDSDESYEFMMLFSDLDSKVERLHESLFQGYADWDSFDDCVVNLLGKKQRVMGYDSWEEDFFELDVFTTELAVTEAGQRLMRLTKAEMLKRFANTIQIVVAFLDIKQQFDYLNATLEILRGENLAVLKALKKVDELYELAEAVDFRESEKVTQDFNSALRAIPDRHWIE